MATSWIKIERSDLRTFDAKSTDLILRAMKLDGVEGRLTTKSHCILRSPSGETMSISRRMNASNRSSQNIESTWNRIFGPLEEEALANAPVPPPVKAPEFTHHPNREVVISTCPVEECKRTFPTVGGLYSHTRQDHAVCFDCAPPLVLAGEREFRIHVKKKHENNNMLDRPAPPKRETGEVFFKCPDCEKSYAQARFLGAHRWKAHGTPGAQTQAAMDSEAMRDRSSDVQCELCQKFFMDNRLLGLHRRTAHGIKSPRAKDRAIELDAALRENPESFPDTLEAVKPKSALLEEEPTEENTAPDQPGPYLDPVIKEIYDMIPERYKANESGPEIARLRGMVEGLQDELDAVIKERNEIQARLDLMREALQA